MKQILLRNHQLVFSVTSLILLGLAYLVLNANPYVLFICFVAGSLLGFSGGFEFAIEKAFKASNSRDIDLAEKEDIYDRIL